MLKPTQDFFAFGKQIEFGDVIRAGTFDEKELAYLKAKGLVIEEVEPAAKPKKPSPKKGATK